MVNVYKLFTNWGGYFSGCGGDAGFLCGGLGGGLSLLSWDWVGGCGFALTGLCADLEKGCFPFSLGIGLGDVGVAFLHLPAILGGFSLCT